VPHGPPCPLDRNCGSLSRPVSRSPGGVGCVRAGDRRRPSRPCSSGGSLADTRLRNYIDVLIMSTIRVPTCFGVFEHLPAFRPAQTLWRSRSNAYELSNSGLTGTEQRCGLSSYRWGSRGSTYPPPSSSWRTYRSRHRSRSAMQRIVPAAAILKIDPTDFLTVCPTKP